MVYRILSRDEMSGGGAALAGCLRWAATVHPSVLSVEASPGATPLIAWNMVGPRVLLRGGFVYVPQNAWAWGGRTGSPALTVKRSILHAVSEIAYRRMGRLIRGNEGIPLAPASVPSVVLPTPLDPQFEDAWSERVAPAIRAPYIAVIGQFIAYKNLDTVVHAYRRYREAGGESRLVIRGKVLDRSIFALVQRLAEGLQDDIEITPGGLSRPEVLGVLAGASTIVFASEVETSPITVLEATVAGSPIVASNIPGHTDMLASVRASAELFEPLDAQDCAEALLRAERGSATPPHALRDAPARTAHRHQWAERLVGFLES